MNMKIWLLSSLFLLSPLTLQSDLDIEQVEDYDDDAFLASNTLPEDDGGLIGWSLFKSEDSDEDRYIINFNNVSILEYLRFVSRISKINFQYEQKDFDFTISILAEEPLTVENIVSALIQTLRARGFAVLENDGNLLLTKSQDIHQIPTIVSPGMKNKDIERAPIITRVFRIQNANLSSLAGIIRPMTSKGAVVDVSNETRQLIVTDIATNVEKVATLLESLDSPHSPLDMELYRAKHISAVELIALTELIVKPFAEDNPLIYVPQTDTNSIFIVTTPSLIERSIEVMEDLDLSPKKIAPGQMGQDLVFLYAIQSKGPEALLDALEEIAEELKDSGSQPLKLIKSLEDAKWVKDSNSLMFITDADNKKKIEEILKTLDTTSDMRNFYIYKIDKAGEKQIKNSLEKLAKSLKKSPSERDLIDAIGSMRYIKETNSLIFTGNDESLKKLKELLPTFDTAVAQYSPTNHFWLYTPKYLSGKELEDAIDDLQDSLESSGLSDDALLTTIESVEWVPSTNTLLFTGDPNSLNRIESMIKLIDVPSGAPTKIFLYRPQFISNDQIEDALDELADKLDHKNISDRNLATAIDNMTWIRDSQTFLFKSDPATIAKIEAFLKDIDSKQEAESIAQSYFLYKLKFARGDDVIDHLEKISINLPEADPSQKAIVEVIDEATVLKEANAVLLTGSMKAVEEVKSLIAQFDTKGSTPAPFDKPSFFIYKPIYVQPEALEQALKETANDLKQSGLIDPNLLQSIDTMRLVEMTNSLIFTGTKESLDKTKEIISTIDTKKEAEDLLGEVSGSNFFIYKARYLPMSEILKLLDKFARNLSKDDLAQNRALIKTIRGAREIKETNSIIFTGPSPVLKKLEGLLKQFDLPAEVAEGLPREPGTYVIYKPKNVNGPELIEILDDFAKDLQVSGVQDSSLYETVETLKYMPRPGYILISGEQKSVSKVQELLKKFDAPGVGDSVTLMDSESSFLIYKLEYHSGDEIQKTLKKIGTSLSESDPNFNKQLINAINSIQWIKITNSLLASGAPDVLTQIKELIQNVDIPLRQVFIEVLIVQTTLSNNQEFGLQWGGKVQYLSRFAGGFSNFPSNNPATGSGGITAIKPGLDSVNGSVTPGPLNIPNPSGGGGLDLGVIGDIILHKGKSFLSLASLVSALQQDNDSVIVLNPKIIAQDNQQANIFVGQNIPFVGSSVTTSGSINQQTSSNIEYRDVGVNLSITPILGKGNIITLDISTEISEQVGNTTTGVVVNGQNNLQGLQTARTTLNTKVHVPDQHFVALSGMIQDNKTHFKSAIPCLGGLPVIGAAFSKSDRLSSRDNIIFFIRPRIIDSIEEYKEITENQENLYKELGVKQIVKEAIDEGIDWVKTPDDE